MDLRLAAAIALNREIFDRLREVDICFYRAQLDGSPDLVFDPSTFSWAQFFATIEQLVYTNSKIKLSRIGNDWADKLIVAWQPRHELTADERGPLPTWIVNGEAV